MLVHLGYIDHPIIAIGLFPDDRSDAASSVFKDDEGALSEIELHDRFFFEELAETELLFMNEERLWFFANFFREVIKEVGLVLALIEEADGFLIPRVTALKKAGFVLPHPPCDLADRFIDAFIHVFGFTGGVDDDVIRAKEDDLGLVAAVSFDIENGLSLDDFWVIKVETLDFALGVFAE